MNYSLKTPEIAEDSDSAGSRLHIGSGTYLLSAGEVVYTMDPQYTAIDQCLSVVGTPEQVGGRIS